MNKQIEIIKGCDLFCIQNRPPKIKAKNNRYQLPNINDILDKLGKSMYFTTLDLASRFHQVELKPDDIEKNSIQHGKWTL